MAGHAVTLKPNGPWGGPASDRSNVPFERPAGPKCEAMKFTYATSARPLEGFTIKRGIGVGGFGEVYYAVSDAGKEVALKRIQRHLDIELRGVGQCLNLKHPNLVSLFDIKYDDQGEAWVVMEYVNGESLRDVLDRCLEGMPIPEAHRWFLGLAAGVAYLHDRGIVHRDLKPGNIFSDEGMVKIGDYGLSKFISASRRSGQTESVGTFHYMAPEIGRGSYGKQIDIYALGIILFEMLTGRVPFEGESTQEIIMKHLTADPDLSHVPSAFREPIRRALMKDPEKRYRSVGEMVEAIGAAVNAATGRPRAHEAIVDAQIVEQGKHKVPRSPSPAAAHGPGGSPAPGVAPMPGATSPHAGSPAVAAAPPWAIENEPIYQVLRTTWNNAKMWLNDKNTNSSMRAVVIVSLALLVAWNAAFLVPIAATLGFLYAIYFAVRVAVLGGLNPAPATRPASPVVPPAAARPAAASPVYHAVTSPSPVGPAMPVPPVPQAVPTAAPQAAPTPEAPRRRLRPSEAVRALLAQRPWTDRARELTSAWLAAAVVASILSAVILMLGDRSATLSVDSATVFAWLWTTTAVGAWSVLTLGKLWENSTGEEVWRRFVMLVAGMGVGLTAWGVDQYLGVRLPPIGQAAVRVPGFEGQLYDSAHQQPQIAAYLLFFGFQFLAIRWWRQADSLRYTRLSLWDAGVCVLAALIVGRFVPFWAPWGMLIPGTMSLTIQLAAPWIDQAKRAKLREIVGSPT
jgi:hypothetical protein